MTLEMFPEPVRTLQPPREGWQHQALCLQLCEQRGVDPNVWFPEPPDRGRGPRDLEGDAHAAKAVCRRCPVRLPCLQAALVGAERYGIWGGLTYAQRVEVAKRTHGTEACALYGLCSREVRCGPCRDALRRRADREAQSADLNIAALAAG